MKKVCHCPVERALSLFERKWNAKVIYALTSADAKRFSELKRDIPDISNMMLTSTLRELEERGIVKREQFNEIPPHVEYSLTEGGRAMKPIFQRMGNGAQNICHPPLTRRQILEKPRSFCERS